MAKTTYRVWLGQINQTYLDVKLEEGAGVQDISEAALRKYRREGFGEPSVEYVQNMDTAERVPYDR